MCVCLGAWVSVCLCVCVSVYIYIHINTLKMAYATSLKVWPAQVYRQNISVEFGDQTIASELLLNASQCDFSDKRLWQQDEITRWFTKV